MRIVLHTILPVTLPLLGLDELLECRVGYVGVVHLKVQLPNRIPCAPRQKQRVFTSKLSSAVKNSCLDAVTNPKQELALIVGRHAIISEVGGGELNPKVPRKDVVVSEPRERVIYDNNFWLSIPLVIEERVVGLWDLNADSIVVQADA